MRSPHLHIVAACLLACAVFRPCSARAQPPSPRADADALLDRAQQALDTNDTNEQIASLRGLNAVAPEPRVTCALGMVERRLGQFPEAAEHLTQCVANPPPGKAAEWLTNMRGEKAMARAEVGILTITAPPGSEVAIDGEERGAVAGREIFLEPKREHRIDVRRGAGAQRHTMTLGRGTTRSLVIVFSEPPLGDWVVFGGVMASGVLAVGSGVLLGVSAALYADAETHRKEAGKTSPDCYVIRRSSYDCTAFKSSFNQAGTLQDSGFIALAVAGGVAATTIVYHVAKPAAGAPQVTVGLTSVGLVWIW